MLQTGEESQWLWTLDRDRRTLFLAQLAHELTIVGRNSYRVQSEDLDQPRQLRETNEILHRVTACLKDALQDSESGGFVESLGAIVLGTPDAELGQLMQWAWQSAKNRVMGISPPELADQ
jgi:hypothetical protein